jgi:enamine deaminase RidA (YjgF/YER057c/UK114 family)
MAISQDGAIINVKTSLDGLAQAGFAQANLIFRYAESLCAAAGTNMANLVRAQYFTAEVREFAGISDAFRSRYADAPHPFVCVGVPSPLPAPGAAIIADFWIYVP